MAFNPGIANSKFVELAIPGPHFHPLFSYHSLKFVKLLQIDILWPSRGTWGGHKMKHDMTPWSSLFYVSFVDT